MKSVLISLVASSLFADVYYDEYHQKSFDNSEKRIELEGKALKNSWLEAIKLNVSSALSKTNSDKKGHTESVYLSLSQDIFKSGGVIYGRKYADAKKVYDLLALDLEKANLTKNIVLNILSLKINRLTQKQTRLTLANSSIEVFLKKEKYTIGEIDVVELNNALMERNGYKKSLLQLQESETSLLSDIQKESDIDAKSVTIPSFPLISQEQFVEMHYDLMLAKEDQKVAEYAYRGTKSDYDPKVTFTAQYGYQAYNTIKSADDTEGTYYSAGFTLSIPFDITAKDTTEASKLSYLQSKLDVQETKETIALTYKQHKEKMGYYESLIKIAKEDIALYDTLLKQTKEEAQLGVKTKYDVKTLENSRASALLDIEINQLNIQTQKATLFFSIKQ